jgi:hypothetical protein
VIGLFIVYFFIEGVIMASFLFLLEMINMTEIEFSENVERGVEDDPKNSRSVGHA